MARRWQTRDQRRAAANAAEADAYAKEFGLGGWRDRRDRQRREQLGAWRRATPAPVPVAAPDGQLDLLEAS